MANKKLFEGIKVAEFAWVVVGPASSRYLADHGATVVKIESHKRLDTNRVNSPFVDNLPTPDTSMFFGRHNPNKFSVLLTFKTRAGENSPGGSLSGLISLLSPSPPVLWKSGVWVMMKLRK